MTGTKSVKVENKIAENFLKLCVTVCHECEQAARGRLIRCSECSYKVQKSQKNGWQEQRAEQAMNTKHTAETHQPKLPSPQNNDLTWTE